VHPWLAAAAWNALRTTSTIRWEVKTFPPQTAAVLEGDRRDLGGILTGKYEFKKKQGREHRYLLSNGTRHPAFNGMSRSSIERMR